MQRLRAGPLQVAHLRQPCVSTRRNCQTMRATHQLRNIHREAKMKSSATGCSPVPPSNKNHGTQRPQETQASRWLCCFGSGIRVTPAPVQTAARPTGTTPSSTAMSPLAGRRVEQTASPRLQESDFARPTVVGSRDDKSGGDGLYPRRKQAQRPAQSTGFDSIDPGAIRSRSGIEKIPEVCWLRCTWFTFLFLFPVSRKLGEPRRQR